MVASCARCNVYVCLPTVPDAILMSIPCVFAYSARCHPHEYPVFVCLQCQMPSCVCLPTVPDAILCLFAYSARCHPHEYPGRQTESGGLCQSRLGAPRLSPEQGTGGATVVWGLHSKQVRSITLAVDSLLWKQHMLRNIKNRLRGRVVRGVGHLDHV